MKYLYLYIDPTGNVKPNNDLLPADLLRKRDNIEGTYFRFCYELDGNRIFIQDHSFREALSKGDEQAWLFLNHALKYLEDKNQARFVIRDWGEPADSGITRKVSSYLECWDYLTDVFKSEFGITPIDFPVYEYIRGDSLPVEIPNDPAFIIPVGSMIGNAPTREIRIGLDRGHENMKGNKDINSRCLNIELLKFYLSHLPEILRAGGREDLVDLCSKGRARDLMFAITNKGKTRVFKSNPKHSDEVSIRQAIKHDADNLLLFCFDNESRRLCIRNKMPSDIYENAIMSKMVTDIKTNVSKQFGLPKHQISVTFDDNMSSGFLSKLSRVKAIWELIKTTHKAEQMKDFPILFVPFETECSVYQSSDDEPDNVKNFRATRGLNIQYPFFVAGSGPRGKIGRQLVDTCLSFFFGKEEDTQSDFLEFIETHRQVIKADMLFLLSLGYEKSDVLDFFAKEFDLLKRAEYRKIFDEICKPRVKVASLGLGLQINDWWKYELQDGINQAQHVNDKPQKKTIKKKDLKKVDPSGPRSYEGLLRTKHDKEMSSQKTMEQLLRESQI